MALRWIFFIIKIHFLCPVVVIRLNLVPETCGQLLLSQVSVKALYKPLYWKFGKHQSDVDGSHYLRSQWMDKILLCYTVHTGHTEGAVPKQYTCTVNPLFNFLKAFVAHCVYTTSPCVCFVQASETVEITQRDCLWTVNNPV